MKKLLTAFISHPVFSSEDASMSYDSNQYLPKILGGTEAKPGAWPWIAALLNANESDMYQAQFCGGVLIDDTWILTAAHCVEGASTNQINVAVGVFDLSNFSGKRIALKSIHIHPQYNTTTARNDIALLQLSSPSSQPAIPLYSEEAPSLLGKMLTAIGWGMADGSYNWYYPNKLRQVNLPAVADRYCNDIYPYSLISSQLCAGYYEGKDVCNGDSGGPVVTQIDGTWFHAGLVSYGALCDTYGGWYGVYSRTSEFIDFIKQYVPDVSIYSHPANIDNDGDGYTENQGDCLDSNPHIFPGAFDQCGDDIDQDCDGSDSICPATPPVYLLLLK